MIPGLAVKGGLVLALAVSLSGYTVAESATQREIVAEQQARERALAQAHRAAVEAERERAVATAQDAIADAAAVQTVAATTVDQAQLAPLTEAVDELHALLVTVPEAPLPAVPGEDGTASSESAEPTVAASGATPTDVPDLDTADDDASATVVERGARASRATGVREPLTAEAPTTEAPTTEAPAADGADPEIAADVAAAAEPTGTADPATDATDATGPAEPSTDEVSDADGGLDDATGAPVPADDAQPDDRVSAEILAAVARVTEVAAQVQATADANLAAQQAAAAAAAEAAAQAAAQAAAEAAQKAAEKAAQRASLDAYANGYVPDEALCELPGGGGHQLRCDASEALTALDAAYRAEFGTPLTISDSYRSYAAQVACVRVKGSLCATPGTSNHGRGVAVDLAGGIQTFGTRQHQWMAANAGQFGWVLPDWAQAGGSKPEAWHWEYEG